LSAQPAKSYRIHRHVPKRKQEGFQVERSFEIAQWMNHNLPAGSRVFNVGEIHLYYYQHPNIREGFYKLARPEYLEIRTLDELARHLKGEGFTHLLFLAQPEGKKGAGSIEKLLEAEKIPRRIMTQIFEQTYLDEEQDEWTYKVYQLL